MSRPQSLSRAQARRVALAAQGFLDKPHDPPTMRTVSRTLDRTGVLQVDSVNVLARAHYMPLYSRMGAYDTGLLERASTGRQQRRLVEYWAHVQAFMPVELWPAMAHRRDHHRTSRGKWSFVAEDDELESRLLAELADRGASTSRDLDDGLPRSKDNWGWNWSRTRRMLDFLYAAGDVAIAGRNSQFEVRYDLPERVLPDAVLAAPDLTVEEQHLALVRRAALSHGVATVKCLSDYYRMRTDDTARAVDTMVETGELEPVSIEGWKRPAYLHRDARRPRAIAARALLSPFDPVVWERERAEQLFDFHYRIEIYTPAEKRLYGYYVLPFLLRDELVGRVDLKADRPTRRLLVKGAYAEAGAPADTALELAAELRRMAGWLGLDQVVVEGRGDLAPELATELATELAGELATESSAESAAESAAEERSVGTAR
ncbi:winged helix-turn-helix domain-containing protein [Nocardioides sp.]|uniref:winged helix-turn-helix domain-containing protein n=1 Tax=Nocardioides sp. TaxID=35761 RepID=UPI0027273C62|nr:crosslink repair DNA glycosylase YcaQ family protein [Nocardioides sp.]MDO9456127.1 crosslink repair DNA glycosylase YcaQ family protein [Nocardioides sp.]